MQGGRRAVRKKTGSFEMRACNYSIVAVDDFTVQKQRRNWGEKIF